MSNNDSCVSCSKKIRNSHKNISCKICKCYVHKKCTKLKPKELRKDNVEWVCAKCRKNVSNTIPDKSDDLCVSCSKIIRNSHKNIKCKICKCYVHKKCTKLKPKDLLKDNFKWVCLKCVKNVSSTKPDNSDDLCVSCSKRIRNCHKNIKCKVCKCYVHKKCTKLKPNELRKNNIEWVCAKCTTNVPTIPEISDETDSLLNCDLDDVDFTQYDNMCFNPLRFEQIARKSHDDQNWSNCVISKCPYLTPNQFQTNSFAKKGTFSILNINIRSLSKNFDKLKTCLKELNHDFSIIGLSETHLKDKPHDYYHLPGYKIEYTNRINREKGGVCLFISDKINYKVRSDLSHATDNYESCFIEIEIPNRQNAVVGVIYRAHTAIDNFIEDIDSVFQIISKESKVSYVMGDYNIDLLKEDSNPQIHTYLDYIYSLPLIPTINKPTRITENTATIIDNILTNADNNVESAILITNISDHLPTVLMSDLIPEGKHVPKQNCVYKRQYTEDNVEYLKRELAKVKWKEVLNGNNVNYDYDVFVRTFNNLHDKCIPLKKCTNKYKQEPRSPWITKCILKSINTKNKLYKKCLSSPTSTNMQKFKTYRNKLNCVIRKAKRSYYFNKFEKARGDMRQTWQTINNVLGRGKKESLPDQFKDRNEKLINDPKNIANEFNNFFVNVGPDLAANITSTGKTYDQYLGECVQNSMFMRPIVKKEIIEIISKFDPNKSTGHDDIGNKIVKKVANEIAEPLEMIFNLSFATGKVPEHLKIAKVIPIYKKSDAENLSNYRPVSVLPCFSKILERLVFNRCVDFIDENDILNEQQFGFRAKHSTYMAIMQVIDKIHNAVELDKSTIGIFLDLSKAFDTIDHNILLYKLQHYGFRGVVYEWFASYLNNRKQYVSFKNNKSEFQK